MARKRMDVLQAPTPVQLSMPRQQFTSRCDNVSNLSSMVFARPNLQGLPTQTHALHVHEPFAGASSSRIGG